MEPVNCFAHVTADKAEIYGPTQAPELIMQTLVAHLGLPKEKIQIRSRAWVEVLVSVPTAIICWKQHSSHRR